MILGTQFNCTIDLTHLLQMTQLKWRFYLVYTLQEHQRNRTNATVSKDSDFSVLMVVYEIIVFYIFSSKSQKSINFLPT